MDTSKTAPIRYLILSFISILVFLSLFTSSTSAYGDTVYNEFYVSDNCSSYPEGYEYCYTDIQAAIDAVNPDGSSREGVINISAGNYSVNLKISNNITLNGLGEDHTTVLKADDSDDHVIDITGTSFIRIRNLKITGANYYNDETYKYAAGIHAYYPRFLSLSGNLIEDNYMGLQFDYPYYNFISHNTFRGNDYAIYLHSPFENFITENEIVSNEKGIIILDTGNSWTTYKNHIEENTISGNTHSGIILMGGDNNNITRNVINNGSYGIVLGEGYFGSKRSLTNTWIKNNTIESNSDGIKIDSTCEHTNIFRNVIRSNDYGVKQSDPDASDTLMRRNLIYDNYHGLYVISGSQVDSIKNWWGSSDGPDSDEADGILGDAIYDPYCVSVDCDFKAPMHDSYGSDYDEIELNESLILFVEVKDNVELDHAWLATNETGTWENKTAYGSPKDLSGISDTCTNVTFEWSNSSLDYNMDVAWRIYYTDTSGNENATEIMTFHILEEVSIPEVINNIISSQSPEYGETVYHTATCQDSGIYDSLTMYCYFYKNDINQTGFAISQEVENATSVRLINVTKDDYNASDKIIFGCMCDDGVNIGEEIETPKATVKNDTINPIIGYIGTNDTDSTIKSNASINLIAEFYDLAGLDHAWLATNETGTWENKIAYGSPKDLSGISDTWTNVTFEWSNSSLDYNMDVAWSIYCNDTSGNEIVTENQTFHILDEPSAPTIKSNIISDITPNYGEYVYNTITCQDDDSVSTLTANCYFYKNGVNQTKLAYSETAVGNNAETVMLNISSEELSGDDTVQFGCVCSDGEHTTYEVNTSIATVQKINITDTITPTVLDSMNTSDDSSPQDIFFSPNGGNLYEVDNSDDKIFQYSCESAWNISTCSYNDVNIPTQDSDSGGIFFNSTGTKLYEIGWGSDNIYEYDCSDSWNLSSCVYNFINKSTVSEIPVDMAFNDDGTKLYELDDDTDKIYELDCESAWNISTCSYNDVNMPVKSIVSIGMFFNGDSIYVVDYFYDKTYRYDCSDSWNLSTCEYSNHFIKMKGDAPTGIFLNDNDVYDISLLDNKIYQYSISESTVRDYGELFLEINGFIMDMETSYPSSINVTGWKTVEGGTLSLKLNDTTVVDDESISDVIKLPAGSYNYMMSLVHDNYTASEIERSVEIAKGAPAISLYLNNSMRNRTVDVESSLNITVDVNASGHVNLVKVKENDTSTESYFNSIPVEKNLDFDSVDNYNLTAYYSENQNYTSASKTFWVNVIELGEYDVIAEEETVYIKKGINNIIVTKESPLELIEISDEVDEDEDIKINVSESVIVDTVKKTSNYTIKNRNLTMRRSTSSQNYSVEIAYNTTITSTDEWDGTIAVPTVNSTNSVDAPEGSKIDAVIDVGSNHELNFTKPVKVLLGGMAGKNAGWTRSGTSVNSIDTECDDLINPTNIDANDTRECYIDSADGNDLVIWTYHFTKFTAYSDEPADSDSGDDLGGGGGGGAVLDDDTEDEPVESDVEEEIVDEEDVVVDETVDEEIEEEDETVGEDDEETGFVSSLNRITGSFISAVSQNNEYKILLSMVILIISLVMIKHSIVNGKYDDYMKSLSKIDFKSFIPDSNQQYKKIATLLVPLLIISLLYSNRGYVFESYNSALSSASSLISNIIAWERAVSLVKVISSISIIGIAFLALVKFSRKAEVPWKNSSYFKKKNSISLELIKSRLKPTFKYGYKIKKDDIIPVSRDELIPKINVPDKYISRGNREILSMLSKIRVPRFRYLLPRAFVLILVSGSILYFINFGMPFSLTGKLSLSIGGFWDNIPFHRVEQGFQAVYGFFINNLLRIGIVLGALAVPVLIMKRIKVSRTPWKTNYYKKRRSDEIVGKMKNVKERFLKNEKWISNA